jgi:RimJ/RimL family protein N-acetyltransferase
VTARLSIRALRPGDAEALFAVRSDPKVARYQTWESFTPLDAEAMIEYMRGRGFRAGGTWYQLAVARREDDLAIGDLALRFPAGEPRHAEIGFNIASRHWRKGYAREAILRFAEWLAAEREIRRVFAVTDEHNHGCRKLLEACGFHPQPGGWRLVYFKREWAGEMVYERPC